MLIIVDLSGYTLNKNIAVIKENTNQIYDNTSADLEDLPRVILALSEKWECYKVHLLENDLSDKVKQDIKMIELKKYGSSKIEFVY